MSQLSVSYSQYYLTSEDVHGSDADENDDGTVDGLTMASPEAIEIFTGTQHGEIDLDVRMLTGAPELERKSWDVVVERSFSTHSGPRQIWDWNNEVHEEFPTVPAGGTFRLRAHARGRDAARFGDGAKEQHLLLIWPAPMSYGETFNMDETGQLWLNPDDSGGTDTSGVAPAPAARAPAMPTERAPRR